MEFRNDLITADPSYKIVIYNYLCQNPQYSCIRVLLSSPRKFALAFDRFRPGPTTFYKNNLAPSYGDLSINRAFT